MTKTFGRLILIAAAFLTALVPVAAQAVTRAGDSGAVYRFAVQASGVGGAVQDDDDGGFCGSNDNDDGDDDDAACGIIFFLSAAAITGGIILASTSGDDRQSPGT